MANLAIKGHATRGKEVIEILEMLGGMMKGKLLGTETFCAYYIDSDGSIDYKHYSRFDDAIQFTLEEFLEKFPYKVGDEVLNVQGTVMPCQIKGMYWDNDCVKYYCEGTIRKRECFDRTAEQLQPYKEQETAEDIIKIDIPKGYEFAGIDNQQVVFEKIEHQYPKTYEECCKIIDYRFVGTTIIGYKKSLLENFQKLLVCRDAYWKIAGDWRPEFRFGKKKYCITTKDNKAISAMVKETNRILVFPTEEMRDAFYENFKDLINKCKELL